MILVADFGGNAKCDWQFTVCVSFTYTAFK